MEFFFLPGRVESQDSPAPAHFGANTLYYYGRGGGGVAYADRYYFNLRSRTLKLIFDNNYLPPDQLSTFLTSADKRYPVHKVEAVVGLQGPERMYVLTDALIRRGYSDVNIRLILGANFQRVLTQTWA